MYSTAAVGCFSGLWRWDMLYGRFDLHGKRALGELLEHRFRISHHAVYGNDYVVDLSALRISLAQRVFQVKLRQCCLAVSHCLGLAVPEAIDGIEVERGVDHYFTTVPDL